MRVYCRRNERFEVECLHETPNRGYRQVTVWGGIRTDHRTAFAHIPAALNGTNYEATILQPLMAPFMQSHPGYILQQENVPAHRARETQVYLAGQHIGVNYPLPAIGVNYPVPAIGVNYPWTAVSRDMSLIEHVWNILGRHIRQINPSP
ncbi:transposable element tc1 transposase [Plakobranchus ocellatus]|uniref:Transposable element tc1 transposase n=1 Tax=Plakobranchus ocellatus TaxID=259542 RepID=A0AAV4DH17_9GAST|nr:transposable element tc1 transposase [Plakobranchus ocellatus]